MSDDDQDDAQEAKKELRNTLYKCNVPMHCWEGIEEYVLRGQIPGSFLCSIFHNDLVGAAANADHINQDALFPYAKALYHLPAGCWGGFDQVTKWSNDGGLLGILAKGRPA